MNTLLKLGTDSEFFVTKDGEVDNAFDCQLGSKEAPLLVDRGNLQEDNILAEFAIDPVDDKQSWVGSINYVTAQLRTKVNRQGKALLLSSSCPVSKNKLLSWGSKAMRMGCEQDYNAYTGDLNPRPDGRIRLRTAAGHVHFSYENPNDTSTFVIVKALDYALGLWSVLEDEDTARRQLYGKAGACRLKIYGGEYRVLGNFWLRSNECLEFVYDTTSLIVEHAEELLASFMLLAPAGRVQAIINNCDKQAAELLYPQILAVMEEHRAKLS